MDEYFYFSLINTLSHQICTADWTVQRRKIDFHNLVFIEDGAGEYQINNNKYPVKKGDVIYVKSGSSRSATCDAGNPLRMYDFGFSLYDQNLDSTELPLPEHSSIGFDAKIEHLLKKTLLFFNLNEPTGKMQASGLMMSLLSNLLSSAELAQGITMDARVQRAAAYVTQNIGRRISAGEISKAVGLHPGYLNKLTAKYTGKTVTHFIHSIRVNMAEEALMYEGISVGQAALRFGYSDIYHFSKVFKKYKGYPPSAAKNMTP